MNTNPIQVRVSFLDALPVDMIGPSVGDHRELLPQAPSRWYVTGFLVPKNEDEDQRYDPNSDYEVEKAPFVAKVDDPLKSIPRAYPGRDGLICVLVDQGFLEKHPGDQKIWKFGASAPSLVATAAERSGLEETKAIFQKSIDSCDNLASCKEGVTDAKPGLVSIA